MKKVLVPLLVGFGVAFLLGFGMTALIAGSGAKNVDMLPIWLPAAIFGAIAAYVAGNLAGNRKVAAASDADRQGALSFTAPAGYARLYVIREGFVGMAAGLNITVDGVTISQLKAPRFTSVVLPVGRHVVQAAFGGLAGPQNNPAEQVVDLRDGQVAVLRAALSMGALKNTITLQQEVLDSAMEARLSRLKMVATDPAAVF